MISVGGGSSGAIVADLLSQTGDSVLILEAGIQTSLPFVNIPVIAALLQQTELDWKYRTEPQLNACLALENNVSEIENFIIHKFMQHVLQALTVVQTMFLSNFHTITSFK